MSALVETVAFSSDSRTQSDGDSFVTSAAIALEFPAAETAITVANQSGERSEDVAFAQSTEEGSDLNFPRQFENPPTALPANPASPFHAKTAAFDTKQGSPLLVSSPQRSALSALRERSSNLPFGSDTMTAHPMSPPASPRSPLAKTSPTLKGKRGKQDPAVSVLVTRNSVLSPRSANAEASTTMPTRLDIYKLSSASDTEPVAQDMCRPSSDSSSPCAECAAMQSRLAAAEKTRRDQHKLLVTVQEDLINATEDCKAFAVEYTKLQTEATELWEKNSRMTVAIKETTQEMIVLATDNQDKDVAILELETELRHQEAMAEHWRTQFEKFEASVDAGSSAKLAALLQEKSELERAAQAFMAEKFEQDSALLQATLETKTLQQQLDKKAQETLNLLATLETERERFAELLGQAQQEARAANAAAEQALASAAEARNMMEESQKQQLALEMDTTERDQWQQLIETAQQESAKHYQAEEALVAALSDAHQQLYAAQQSHNEAQAKTAAWAQCEVDAAQAVQATLRTRITALEAEVDALTSRNVSLREFADSEQEAAAEMVAELEQTMQAATEETLEATRTADRLTTQLRTEQKQTQELSSQLSSAVSQLETVQQAIQTHAAHEAELVNSLNAMKQEQHELEQTYQSTFELSQTQATQISGLQKELATIQAALASAQSQESTLSTQLAGLTAHLTKYKEAASAKMQVQQENLKRAEEEVDSLDLMLSSVRSTLAQNRQHIQHVPKLASLLATLNVEPLAEASI
ncbi:hypothetical protein CAOG_06535 [Capsaspora owczarzaki ATCC 30864]|uniref:hypothetical protein n=1 Tax=Capsaspora owczarzaki (strain ATCC 30864) TaxID=595528 RepID=UPI0003526387|nr:hypothetical protein CAOG_06535 [Capsaspora owczarzaki ATCC 30864]|eukprot:XP_004345284.2 hypothetical protein CAOG_06535 [Capsaspora owczarzaki ATCC 30864]